MCEEDALISNTDSSSLPKAYFIFPKNWQSCESSQYMSTLKSVEGKYQRVIVLPERNTKEAIFANVGAHTVAVYSDLCAPAEESITIFPIPCRDLVIKTALCFSEDFEGCWIRKCIEKGLPVYLKKETPMFTGKEPAAYQRKVLSYYQDVKAYGISFLDEQNGLFKELPGKKETKTKVRFITTQDLRDVPQNGEYRIHAGDILTALARDYVDKFGIRIIEE